IGHRPISSRWSGAGRGSASARGPHASAMPGRPGPHRGELPVVVRHAPQRMLGRGPADLVAITVEYPGLAEGTGLPFLPERPGEALRAGLDLGIRAVGDAGVR